MTRAPLGPIETNARTVAGRDATTYTDQLGREYNSIEHVIRCAIAKELGL